jgi:hypothetical protein
VRSGRGRPVLAGLPHDLGGQVPARSRPGSPCPRSSGVSARCTANWSLRPSAGPPASGRLARAGHRVHRGTQPGRVRKDLRGGNAHMPEQILHLIQGVPASNW